MPAMHASEDAEEQTKAHRRASCRNIDEICIQAVSAPMPEMHVKLAAQA